jgi:hypothetical protein
MALFLTSTTSKLQLITGSAANIDVHASWADNNAGTVSAGSTNTPPITTATTTDIVGAPGASIQRSVRGLYITNVHASQACQATLIHTDGTNAKEIMGVTLLPGENLNFDSNGEWHHRDAQGAEYFPAWPPQDAYSLGYGITGTVAETMSRNIAGVNVAPLATGVLFLQAVYLRAGQKISNISFFSGTQATVTGTHGLFGLYSAALALLATTADFTSEAWAASTVKTKALTAAYTVPTTGLYYVGIMIAATTVPSLVGVTAAAAAGFKGMAPILSGASTTALTTTLPNPCAAPAANVNSVWAGLT